MSNRKRQTGAPPLESVAGNGLLHRRALLGRGIFLAGDDISWTPGWVEGAVQTALNALYSPFVGWVTTTLAAVKIVPPPTGIAPAAPSTTSLAAGAFFGAALLGTGPVDAGLAEGPMAMADGAAAPCGGTPASSAS